MVLDMAASGDPQRPAVTGPGGDWDIGRLARGAWALAERLRSHGASAVLYVGPNHVSYPVCLFAAAAAGVPFVPLNYRLGEGQLRSLVGSHPGALVVHDGVATVGGGVERGALLAELGDAEGPAAPDDPELVAVLLYTSGTTAEPKAAVLRHRHLLAYVFGTVEFGGAGEDEAALVAVPPYHVAGLTNVISNVYAGRRIVYLDRFDPGEWLDAVRTHGVTQAMVVPTMLARIVEHLGDTTDAAAPTLRNLSYGGARMPVPVLERAMALFPGVNFVNAYGLTETSSTIALLGPDDHRAAFESQDPAVRARLGSVGRPLPGIELEIRDEDGNPTGAGEPGLIFVRGDQVSGEYSGSTENDSEGWFATRDRGWLDPDGYLFIEGRADDTIIRGGENIAPAEIEDVLLTHPDVADVAVVGPPDEEWGQRLVGVVVPAPGTTPDPDELRRWARQRLRSSKTPDEIRLVAELPRTDTGKLLRRRVLEDLTAPL